MLAGMGFENSNFFFFFISEILLQEIPSGILILRLSLYLETDL